MQADAHAAHRRSADAQAYIGLLRNQMVGMKVRAASKAATASQQMRSLRVDLGAAMKRCTDAMAYAVHQRAAERRVKAERKAVHDSIAALKHDLTHSQRRCADAMAFAAARKQQLVEVTAAYKEVKQAHSRLLRERNFAAFDKGAQPAPVVVDRSAPRRVGVPPSSLAGCGDQEYDAYEAPAPARCPPVSTAAFVCDVPALPPSPPPKAAAPARDTTQSDEEIAQLRREVATLRFENRCLQGDVERAHKTQVQPILRPLKVPSMPLQGCTSDEWDGVPVSAPTVAPPQTPTPAARPASSTPNTASRRNPERQVRKLKAELELVKRQLSHLRITAVKSTTPKSAPPEAPAPHIPGELQFLNDPHQRAQIAVLKAVRPCCGGVAGGGRRVHPCCAGVQELERVRSELSQTRSALSAEKGRSSSTSGGAREAAPLPTIITTEEPSRPIDADDSVSNTSLYGSPRSAMCNAEADATSPAVYRSALLMRYQRRKQVKVE